MSLSDLYAIGIGTGYAIGIVGVWRYRHAFVGLASFGVLLYPLLGLWSLFYFSLPFINEAMHRDWYVWISRTAHTISIALIILILKVGQAILATLEEAHSGGD